MNDAGLTHGGFYAHFRSREALMLAALEAAFASLDQRFLDAGPDAPGAARLGGLIDHYLSPEHRDHPERGCPLVALASDLPRQSAAVRAVYEAGLRRMIDRLVDCLGDTQASELEAKAASILAEMVGALSLSRSVAEPGLSDQILSQCRASLKARFNLPT